jgi:hypothetical protein
MVVTRVAAGLAVRHVLAIAVVASVARTARVAFGGIRTRGSLVALGTLGAFRTLVAVAALRAVAVEALVALRAIVAAVVLRQALLVAGFHLVVVAVVLVAVAAGAALLFEAGAAFAEDPVIMVGVLQIIFGLDAIAPELRVARHALVFFEELGGVTALPIVLAVAVGPATEVLGPLPAATASAAALSIIDQMLLPSK